MDYEIGSIADLISGLHTPNRPRLQCRALTPEKRPPVDNDTPRSSPPKSARSRKPPTLSTELTRPTLREKLSTEVDSCNVKPSKPLAPVKPLAQSKPPAQVEQLRKSKNKNNFQFLSQLSDFESDGESTQKYGPDDFVKEYYEDKNGIREVSKKNKSTTVSAGNVEVKLKNKVSAKEPESNVDLANGDTSPLKTKKELKELKKLRQKQKKAIANSEMLNKPSDSNQSADEMATVDSQNKSPVNVELRKSKGKRKVEEEIDHNKVKTKKRKNIDGNEVSEGNELNADYQPSVVELENEIQNDPVDGLTDFQRAAQRRIENKKKKEKKFEDDEMSRTIFVGNIPVTILKNKYKKILRAKFSPYGTIETIRIRNVPVEDLKINPKVAFIEKKFHPERSTVTAYIKFAEAQSVGKALVENNTQIEENHIRVDSCSGGGKPQVDVRKTLFLGNLPFNCEEEKVRQLFINCGTILSVRIIRDKKTQIGKGFGFVNFEKSDGVEFALSMSEEDLKIDKKLIRLKRYNTYNPKGDNTYNVATTNRKNSNKEFPNSNQRPYQLQKATKKRDEQGNKIRKRHLMPPKDKKRINNEKSDVTSSNDSQTVDNMEIQTFEDNNHVEDNKITEKRKPHNDSFKGLVAIKKKKNKVNKGELRKKKLSKLLTHKATPRI